MIGTGRVWATSAIRAPRVTTISTPRRSARPRAIASAKVRQRMFGSMPLSSTRSRSAAGHLDREQRVRGPVDLAGLPLDQADRRPVDLEVVELLGVDPRHRLGSSDAATASSAAVAALAASFQPAKAQTSDRRAKLGRLALPDHRDPSARAYPESRRRRSGRAVRGRVHDRRRGSGGGDLRPARGRPAADRRPARRPAVRGSLRVRAQGPADGSQRRRLPRARAARPHRHAPGAGSSARPTGSGCASSAATRSSSAAGSSAIGASWSPSSTTCAGSSPGRSTRPSSCPPPIARSRSSRASSSTWPARSTTPACARSSSGCSSPSRSATEFRRAPCTRARPPRLPGWAASSTRSPSATLVGEICQLHPRLDSDLLMAAALVHDVGKTREFTYGAEFGVSEEGRLLGHLAIGAQMVAAAAGRARRPTAGWRCSTACSPITAPTPARVALAGRRLAGARLRLGRGAGALPLNALDASVKGALEHGSSTWRSTGAYRH